MIYTYTQHNIKKATKE